jgi:hypothetical protein
MGLVIGTDEAGYGPNLGPLVITATAWRVPGNPRDFDFWSAFEEVVTNEPRRSSGRLHVADSKQVYSPSKGLRELERSVLTLLSLAGTVPESFRTLCQHVSGLDTSDFLDVEPWFVDANETLPVCCTATDMPGLATGLQDTCAAAGIELQAVRSEIVLTERFNRLTAKYDSKGAALSRLTLGLIRSVWDPDSTERVLIISDKHGGRNRYDELIDEQLDGQMIFRVRESRQKSSYRIGQTDMHFQQGAERHFPAAVSSMVCKYVRELSMELFNRFWQNHVPDLRPTKGYPTDAKRFRSDIAEAQQKLGISDNTLWRER